MAYLNPGAGMPATTLHEALTEEPEVGDTSSCGSLNW
jgi:hypothetical protein